MRRQDSVGAARSVLTRQPGSCSTKLVGLGCGFGTICTRLIKRTHCAVTQEKVYVQDLIRRDSAKIWSQIDNDKASVFVCGDAKHMAADVAVI